jgi:hypothetical protein
MAWFDPVSWRVLGFQDLSDRFRGHDGHAGSEKFMVIMGPVEEITQGEASHRRVVLLQEPGSGILGEILVPVAGHASVRHGRQVL